MNIQKEKQLLVEVTPPGEEIDNNIIDKKQKTQSEDQSENQIQEKQ